MSLSKLSKCPGQQQRSGEEMGCGLYTIIPKYSEVRNQRHKNESLFF